MLSRSQRTTGTLPSSPGAAVGERDRARKEFVDATRAKVLSAAQRHVEERRKKEENSITPGQAPTPAPPPPPASGQSTGGRTPGGKKKVGEDGGGGGKASKDNKSQAPGTTGPSSSSDAAASRPMSAVAGAVLAGMQVGGGGAAQVLANASLGQVMEAIDDLTRRRRALVQAGFEDEANEVATATVRLREMADAKKRENEQKMFKQKLWALQLSQKHDGHRLQKELDAKKSAADGRWKEEVEAMKARQAAEYQKNVEIITKAAALEDVELPRRLVKYRYRASPQLQHLRETMANLRATNGLKEMIDAVQAKAEAMEEAEVGQWRENFLRVALGSDSSSYISQLLASQQVTWDKTLDRMRKEQHAFESAQQQEQKALQVHGSKAAAHHITAALPPLTTHPSPSLPPYTTLHRPNSASRAGSYSSSVRRTRRRRQRGRGRRWPPL